MKKLFQTLWICLLLLTSGCRPEGVLSQGEMADLLTDLYLTDGYIDADGDGLRAWDSLDVYGPRLAAHGVTLPQFETSVEYYLHHPRDFSKIYDDVQENLEKAFNEVTRQIEIEEEVEEAEVEPAVEETVNEQPDRPVREGVEPRIERADKTEKVDKVETTDKQDKKQAPKRRNSRKKLSKKELEELEKQLKQ